MIALSDSAPPPSSLTARYLFVLDVAIAVLGASMVIGVGVSALLLAVHLDSAPEQRDSMISLLVLTAAYLAPTLTAAAGAVGLRRGRRWHWAAQLILLFTLFVAYFVSLSMLAAS